ncbi:MAG: tRNA pseudouridine(38-40) synthase TruA [Chitinophagaceae bacterium]|jgi:tRNA pseudouridine38-40 synthase|nr:tRNA pseudouridine(38-40) synthase TruA [Chitinophagaceae bacterium]
MDNISDPQDAEHIPVSRYFIEVTYKGGAYKGFQIQAEDITIQSEVEKALHILLKKNIRLTGSSRTDAGVHALQNYFHFDTDLPNLSSKVYNINALLPRDIVVKNIFLVADDAHCRFLATSREYQYRIYFKKDPFLYDRAWFYPFKLNTEILHETAAIVKEYTDFTSFSKRNTQVKTCLCNIEISQWTETENGLIYEVKGNRFLRGMVRGLVGTMLKAGKGIITPDEFRKILEAKDCTKADFSPPPQGLFLIAVNYPEGTLCSTPPHISNAAYQ